MRKSVAAAAILLGLGGPAIASDLYSPSAAPVGVQSFAGTVVSGAYVSIGGGAALASAHVPQAASDFALAGPIGDVRAGWDYKLSNTPWLVGILAGISFEDVTGSAQGTAVRQVIGYEGGIRAGRIVGGNALIYGVLLYHGQHIGLTNTSFSTDMQGIEPGLGLEIELKNGITLGGELDYTLYRPWQAGNARIGENELKAEVRLGIKPSAFQALN
jgi:opacity protein-like surface antigen